MQRNSTSTILRRAAIVVGLGVVVHVLARLLWHWQVFGLNTVLDCQVTLSETICQLGRETDFWHYAPDATLFLVTHLLGVSAVAFSLSVVAWIVLSPTLAGYKDYSDCTNPECPCERHGDQKFSAKKRKWV